ncbi:MAG TPA: SpoIIE family protein phosphatase [Streptosporangiaceae bacterium]
MKDDGAPPSVAGGAGQEVAAAAWSVPAEIAGLQLSVRCAPDRTRSRAPDDSYELLQLASGRWGIAVIDMKARARNRPGQSGKLGPPPVSAETTGAIGMARAGLHSAAQVESSPGQVLASFSRWLHGMPPVGSCFFTAFYATVRPSVIGALVRICAAGMQTVYLRRADGSVLVVPQQETFLGLSSDSELREERLLLRPGDSLILVTGSVTGADRTSSGSAWLARVMADLGSMSAARTAEVVLNAVRERRGVRADDKTIVLVLKMPSHRRGSGTHSAGWPGARRYPEITPSSGWPWRWR